MSFDRNAAADAIPASCWFVADAGTSSGAAAPDPAGLEAEVVTRVDLVGDVAEVSWEEAPRQVNRDFCNRGDC